METTADDFLTGSDIARYLGVSHTTWGRWVADDKAPQPRFTAGVAKMYATVDVDNWAAGIAALLMEEAA